MPDTSFRAEAARAGELCPLRADTASPGAGLYGRGDPSAGLLPALSLRGRSWQSGVAPFPMGRLLREALPGPSSGEYCHSPLRPLRTCRPSPLGAGRAGVSPGAARRGNGVAGPSAAVSRGSGRSRRRSSRRPEVLPRRSGSCAHAAGFEEHPVQHPWGDRVSEAGRRVLPCPPGPSPVLAAPAVVGGSARDCR